MGFKLFDYALKDVLTIKYGKNQKKVVDEKGEYPILGTGGIMGYANQFLYNKPSVLIGRKGSIRRVRFIEQPFWTVDTLFYTEINEDIVYPRYIYYYLSQIDFQHYNEGTTIPSLRTETLNRIKVSIPSQVEQRKILNVINPIEEKIRVNEKLIESLEQLTQTLFKHWFVDFEFPNENGEPYKSSGGEMVESELGTIPKNWTVELLGDVSEIQNGFAFKSKDYIEDGIKVLRTLNIHPDGLLVNNNDLKYLPNTFYSENRYEKQRLQKFDPLLVMVGATIGKLGMVLSANVPSLQNQNMWRFRAKKSELSNTVLYFYLKKVVEESINWRSGSAREFFRKDSFSKYLIAIPSDDILIHSKEVFEKIFNKIDILNSEVGTLESLRDTLLPKLLSGEIELPEDEEVGL